ncbi:MAG: hypothetical protein HYT28_01435 [Parcubacteria group bacterium]|nr:hypothetical protein [Parcubacteria group bacterium]
MDKDNYYTLSAFSYLIIAVVFAFTIFNNGSVVINNWLFPVWLNWVVILLSGYLSYESFQMKK